MSNLETVQEIYAAFGSGDLPAILVHLADDCAWESWTDNYAQRAGVDHLMARTGPAGAVEFFGAIGAAEVHDFVIHGLLDGGDSVGAEIEIEITPAGGTRFRDEEFHLWTFGPDGKVTRLRHYVDTAKHIAGSGR